MPTAPAEEPIITHRPRRQYSDREQATALAALQANAGQIRKTARELDIPENTLRQWEAGQRRGTGDGANPALSAAVKAEMSVDVEMLARRMLHQAGRKVKEMSGSAAVIGAAVCIDKMLLLRGESPRGGGLTVNVTNNTLTVNTAAISTEALQEARQLLSRALALPVTSEAILDPSCNDCAPSQPDHAGAE